MTERKRPSRLAAAAARPTTPRRSIDDTPPVAEVAPSPAPAARKAPKRAPRTPESAPQRSGVKYTAILDDDSVDAFEALTRAARRRKGRHVDKIEVLKALLMLAADDAALRDQVIDSLS